MNFSVTKEAINPADLAKSLHNIEAGGYCSFEGWVRNHHLGKGVIYLEYEAYHSMAVKIGAQILEETMQKYELAGVSTVHRIGKLYPGDLAVWVGVSASHRDAAFKGCRYIIDTVKDLVPIWKHEFYTDGTDVWVDPTACKK